LARLEYRRCQTHNNQALLLTVVKKSANRQRLLKQTATLKSVQNSALLRAALTPAETYTPFE
jgi:hypothetical protein